MFYLPIIINTQTAESKFAVVLSETTDLLGENHKGVELSRWTEEKEVITRVTANVRQTEQGAIRLLLII